MTSTLAQHLAPRLKHLDRGSYLRQYRRGERRYRSSLHAALSEILEAVAPGVEEDIRVPGTSLRADFKAGSTFVFVDRELGGAEVRELKKLRNRCLVVRTSSLRDDLRDAGVRVVQMGGQGQGDAQTIFLDDPSFNFDYAHILPHTEKCSVMHGHTSSVLVEVTGYPVDGMVVDFGVAKDVIREAIRGLDHRLFINRKYVTEEDVKCVTVRFRTVHGNFMIRAPKNTTVLLGGEATVENLAKEVMARVSPRMPENITAVGVYVYEGLNKGSYILAQLHHRGVDSRRKL